MISKRTAKGVVAVPVIAIMMMMMTGNSPLRAIG